MSGGDGIIGKTLGKCKILGRLGYGNTSSIFRAWYEPLGKEVAVKILKEDMKASEELRGKFLNEAKALAKLDHENIVKVFDVVEEGGYLFIVMELLKGRDVWQILKDEGHVEPEKAVEIATGIARALETAHREGIVHRDVKPQNIMVAGRRGQPKLLDFGLATEGLTAGRAGTPHYMSPEQIQGKRIDEKSDIYSLGATFFHMLTGRPPYSGKTTKEIMEQHLAGDLPTPSRANRELSVPKALDPVVKRMMAPVPGYRYPARDLVTALDDLNLAAGGRKRRTHAVRAASRRQKSNMPLVLGAAGMGLLVVVLLLVVLLTGGDSDGPDGQGDGGRTAEGDGPSDIQRLGPGTARAGNPPPAAAETPADKARQAFQLAESFAANHPRDWDAIIAEYEKVWDEYRDTSWGQKARNRMREADMAREAILQAERDAERAKRKAEAQKLFEEKLDKAVEAYDFETARELIDDHQLTWGEDEDLQRKGRLMEFSSELIVTLAEEITLNRKKYKLSLFKSSASPGAVIESADPDRILIKEGELERREPWGFLEPRELARLAMRQLSSRDPKTYCLVYALQTVTGNEEEAKDTLRNGELVDSAGFIQEFRRQLKID